MDDADRAQAEQEMLETLRRQRTAPEPAGRETCAECGITIPADRRLAVPSATHCLPCAIELEQRRALGV